MKDRNVRLSSAALLHLYSGNANVRVVSFMRTT
jgi:hypothetical protein